MRRARTGNALHTLCGVLASLILLALIIKIVCCFAGVKEAMQNSVVASVSGTLPMALMLLSVYWKHALGGGAKAIWFFAIALHGILIVWFTYKFFRRPKLENIFASYFIVYVGIVVAAVSAPAYGMEKLGAGTFWFGLVCLKKLGAPLPWLKPVVLAETVLATILVFYALIRYCINACKSKAAVK